jgi:hypothetical protein
MGEEFGLPNLMTALFFEEKMHDGFFEGLMMASTNENEGVPKNHASRTSVEGH